MSKTQLNKNLSQDTEEEFLKSYDASVFKRPSTSVDSVIYTVFDDALHVLVVKRENHPFRDSWSLVGGYIDLDGDMDLKATARRKLEEKTGVKTPYLEQFSTIGNKQRDPRGWSVTTVYFALIPSEHIILKAGNGASDIKWMRVENGKIKVPLAFDHAEILKNCTERLQNKVLYTSLPVHLMPNEFTLNELQSVYEIILEKEIEHKSFRRRILGAEILKESGAMKDSGRRPAKLYKRNNSVNTHFFVRNLEGPHD